MAYNYGLAGKTFVYSWYRNGKGSGEPPEVTIKGKILWDGFDGSRHAVKFQKDDGEICGWYNDRFSDAMDGWCGQTVEFID
jgi:hypothetical protein